MESNLFMSRDIVVNILLGVLLVSVFLLPFFLFVVVAGYVLQALSLRVEHLFPRMPGSQVMLVGIFLAVFLFSAVRDVWKRRWLRAFLSLAILPMIASVWLAGVHSPLGLRTPFWVLTLFPVFAIPEGSTPTRSQFFLAASIICAVIAINTGLLGSGAMARIAADCLMAGAFLWFVIDASSSAKNPGPKAPLSPTRA